MHQDSAEKRWVPPRAEDFLATDQEKERCSEVLMRSTNGLWYDVKHAECSGRLLKQLRGAVVKRSYVESARLGGGKETTNGSEGAVAALGVMLVD